MVDERLIPAHAGKTASTYPDPNARRAHPRSRGENKHLTKERVESGGSSPLTRGKRTQGEPVFGLNGLIPAHAGKTTHCKVPTQTPRAHPRSRGENGLCGCWCRTVWGSSPLTRGKQKSSRKPPEIVRLIPAHAGKTPFGRPERRRLRAHPRSRGENSSIEVASWVLSGSSPLTRGKRIAEIAQRSLCRLIPAHAGKTLPDLRFYCADRSDLGNP